MSRLGKSWANGLEAGNLVYYRDLMAQVAECIPGIIPDGMVPVVFLRRPERDFGIVPIPADDLELLTIPPLG